MRMVYIFIAFLLLAGGGGLYYWMESRDDCLSLVDNPSAWQDVLTSWERQEIVLVVRHTSKCDGDLPDCPSDDEYLTEKGEQEAAVIGEGLKVLPGDYVAYHSPMKRTRDTASIALGNKSSPKTWLATACKTDFQDYFFDLPEGNNYLLVTHSGCLDNFQTKENTFLLGFDSGTRFHFGLAAFFKRFTDEEGEKQPGLLGCVWPDDWEALPAKALD